MNILTVFVEIYKPKVDNQYKKPVRALMREF